MQTISYLNKKHSSLSKDGDVYALYDDFKKYGIKVSFPSTASGSRRRFIFSPTGRARFRKQTDKFIEECNGLICVYDSSREIRWSVLVKPMGTFRNGVKKEYINRNLDKA